MNERVEISKRPSIKTFTKPSDISGIGKLPPQALDLEEAVLGANVVLTASTKIIDVSGKNPFEYKGLIPSRSVVIPGSIKKDFPSGEYSVPCALIIGKRKESTDKKTSLNDALRTYNVAV